MSVRVMAKENGLAISNARVDQGMSMRDLANKSGLSIGAISNIENGKVANVRPANAQKISRALSVHHNTLFDVVKNQKGV